MLLAISLLLLPAASSGQNFSIKGRLHMDAFYGIREAEQFSNGFNNRRARIGLSGKISDNWDGVIEVDLAEAALAPSDIRLRRNFSNGGRLHIGQFKVPQSHSWLTSSNDMPLAERPSPVNVFSGWRRMGVAYDYYNSRLGFMAMIFGRAIGERNLITGDMPLGVAFRGVVTPALNEGVLHLAASVVYQDLMGQYSLRYRDRPEAHDAKGGLNLINVEVAGVQQILRTGAELQYIRGPLSLEAEYLQGLSYIQIGQDPIFRGFYLQGSYFLTGESRSYSRGVPGGITPQRASGAWEVAARFSYTDLNDAAYTGGLQQNITLGLNYYAASNLRFMANIIFADVDLLDQNPVLGVLRAQFHF